MKKTLPKLSALIFSAFIFIAVSPLFSGEDAPAVELNKRVRTEGLTGINLFLANLYNNDRLLFAVVSTVSVVVLGLIVTYIVGLFIKPHVYHEKPE
jgi:hypothetical protein